MLKALFVVSFACLSILNAAAAQDELASGLQAYEAGQFDEAARLFKGPANDGNHAAQFALGLLHEFGQGVPKNPQKAALWYAKAAAQGLPDALYRLGLLYSKGVGVPANQTNAIRLMIRAAQHGYQLANEWLSTASESGNTLAKTWTEQRLTIVVPTREYARDGRQGHPETISSIKQEIARVEAEIAEQNRQMRGINKTARRPDSAFIAPAIIGAARRIEKRLCARKQELNHFKNQLLIEEGRRPIHPIISCN